MGNRFSSQGATDGHKTNNISAGYLKFGFGRGETLCGKVGFVDSYTNERGEEVDYIFHIGIDGLIHDGMLETKTCEGLKEVKGSDRKWHEYHEFVKNQVETGVYRIVSGIREMYGNKYLQMADNGEWYLYDMLLKMLSKDQKKEKYGWVSWPNESSKTCLVDYLLSSKEELIKYFEKISEFTIKRKKK